MAGTPHGITLTFVNETLCRLLGRRRESLPGLDVTPSQANFLWLRTAKPAGELYEALKQRSILVRSFHARGGRLANQLRITIGTPAENDALCSALTELA